MYQQHFGLRAEAFSLTPDPAFLYLSPGHSEALAGIEIALRDRRGLMVMTGEVGTGKTTLLYSILNRLGSEARSAYIANTTLSFEDILRQALKDFGVPCDSREKPELVEALNAFLIQCAAEGVVAALVIDEAQNLDRTSLENLRLLSNYETFSAKLLQIVLVGQPELETKLQSPSLRQVAERVAVHCHVNPLTRTESRNYIQHRLEAVGGSLDIFTPGAVRVILRRARGIPRRINILCHNALLFTYGRELQRVPTALARAAVREQAGAGLVTIDRRRFPAATSWLRPALATAALVLATLGAVAAARWQDAPTRPDALAAAAETRRMPDRRSAAKVLPAGDAPMRDADVSSPKGLGAAGHIIPWWSVETLFAGTPAASDPILSCPTTLGAETSFAGGLAINEATALSSERPASQPSSARGPHRH